jgi:hypothetical protein
MVNVQIFNAGRVGTCVHKTRSLYAYYEPGMYYNDLKLCQAALPPSKGSANPYHILYNLEQNTGDTLKMKAMNFKLSPNPVNDGFITCHYNIPQDAELQITDLTGRVILQSTLSADNNIATIALDNFVKGLYIVHVIMNAQIIYYDKIIIH